MILVQVTCFVLGARADDPQSYQALVSWIEQNRSATPTFSPGQRLTEKDWEAIKPFIPQSAWEYYHFAGMDMEIDATHTYPFPPHWGQGLPADRTGDKGCLLMRASTRMACSSDSPGEEPHSQRLNLMIHKRR